MRPTELQRRLLVAGAVEVPTGYPPGLAERWAHYLLSGHTFEVPRADGMAGADAVADDAAREIKRLVGVRLDWPAWLDVAIDRCPACGGDDVVIEEDGAGGWASECRPTSCGAVYRWPGSLPTWAERLALTLVGRWALHGLGHPLGVAR